MFSLSAIITNRFLTALCCALAPTVLLFSPAPALAQEAMQPGEAFVTRFSGTSVVSGRTVIDTAGTVGSIVDIRNPGGQVRGAHWLSEPQRGLVSAGDVGQIFGVAIYNDAAPSVYLTATSAFGLHRSVADNSWMPGRASVPVHSLRRYVSSIG